MKWTYIFYLPAAVAIIGALILIMFKNRPTPAQLLLALTHMMEGFGIMLLCIFFRGRTGSLFIFDFMIQSMTVLCIPLFYISLCSQTESRGVTLGQRRVFLIPLAYIVGLTFGAWKLGPVRYEALCVASRYGEATWIQGDTAWNFMFFWEHWFAPALLMFFGFVLILMATRKMRVFRDRFNTFYAERMNAPKINVRGLQFLAWAFIPLAVLVYYAVYFRPPYAKYILIVASLLLTVEQLLTSCVAFMLDFDSRFLAHYVKKIDRQ